MTIDRLNGLRHSQENTQPRNNTANAKQAAADALTKTTNCAAATSNKPKSSKTCGSNMETRKPDPAPSTAPRPYPGRIP